MKIKNVLSLFDGMSCGQIALNRAGIEYDKYYASEIDKYAIQIAKKNYPNTIHLGDVTKWKEWDIDWSSIGLLIGGSPCQGFSFAGKQLAFDDPRSKLFFVYVDILNHIKQFNPDVKFMLENVRMKKEHQAVITEYLGIEPVIINSALVSAQNRVRYYWTNIGISTNGLFNEVKCNIEQPIDKGILWGHIRECGVETEKYYYSGRAMQWLAKHSQRKVKMLTIHTDVDKMQMVEASHCKGYSSQRFFGIVDIPPNTQSVAAMRGRFLVNGKRQDGKQVTAGLTEQYIEFRYDGKTNALTTVGKDNIIVPFTLPNRVPASEFFFRYITPVECERLQTVPDNYTQGVSDTQRYRMLGNGWTVDVIVHIFGYLK